MITFNSSSISWQVSNEPESAEVNGGLSLHEAPVKFPRAPQRFLLTKLVVKEDVPLASVCSSW